MTARGDAGAGTVSVRSRSEGSAFGGNRGYAAVTIALVAISALTLLTGFSWTEAWNADDKAALASMSLDKLPRLQSDPSNAVADAPAAAELGKRLFADVRFSRNQAVSCATCHAPDLQFQDGLPVGKGVGTGSRRTMPIAGAAHSPWLFWDGRKDSMWSQALGPLEDAVEHGGNRTRIAKLLRARYKAEYEALFGPMPDLAGLPEDAGPLGNPAERAAWQSMDPRRRKGGDSGIRQPREGDRGVRADSCPRRVAI